MAVGISDFNETEDFEQYNPHPYQGGYDIALTYGNPLPPFSAICYPMSEASSHPPLPEVTLSLVPGEIAASPETGERAISTSVGREDDLPKAEYGSSYGYGDWGGFSPFMMNDFEGWTHDAEEMRYWRPLRRAADFIFGYSQGFGERRIGVDSYGIPIYAYKSHGSDAVDVEIQPARTEKLEYHNDSERCFSAYNNWENKNYRLDSSTHAYLQHHSEESFDAKVDPVESLFSWKPGNHGRYDELYPGRQWVPLSYGESRNEVNLNRNNEMYYDKHHYSGAQNVQLEPVENSLQKIAYHEASQEFSHTDSNWERSYSIHGDERNTFTNAYHCYESWDYEKPSNFELDPYKPTWAHYPVYYGISEEDVYSGSQPISDYSEVYNDSSFPRSAWQASSFGERNIEGDFLSLESYQPYHDGHSLELEPYKPTWMLNPSYYGVYEDIPASYKQDDDEFYVSDWSVSFLLMQSLIMTSAHELLIPLYINNIQ